VVDEGADAEGAADAVAGSAAGVHAVCVAGLGDPSGYANHVADLLEQHGSVKRAAAALKAEREAYWKAHDAKLKARIKADEEDEANVPY
jgi:hypothetical protein